MNVRAFAILIAAVLVLVPGTATAHIRDDSGFLFGAMTLDKERLEKTIDPINAVYYPYARALGAGNTSRIHTHHKAHWRPHWATADEFSNAPYCKGNQRLLFRGTPVKIPENEDHGAGWADQPSGLDNCRTRYHIRMWSDTFASDTHSQERETWAVGDMHHERIRGFQVRPPPCWRPFASSCSAVRFKGHYIDKSWEAVELATITKMRRSARTSGHLDARGQGANQGHCNKYRWKPLPGSGPDKIQERYSDGWLTRVSLLHCARGTR